MQICQKSIRRTTQLSQHRVCMLRETLALRMHEGMDPTQSSRNSEYRWNEPDRVDQNTIPHGRKLGSPSFHDLPQSLTFGSPRNAWMRKKT